jgi:hypothetical protein
MKKSFALLLLLAAGLAVTSAHAGLLISNLGDNTNRNELVPATLAQGFTTGAQSGLILDSVTLKLTRNDTGGNLDLDPVSVALLADSGGLPGATLTNLGLALVPKTGTGLFSFTAGSGFALQPGTTYWIAALGGDTVSKTAWNQALTNTVTGLPGWSPTPVGYFASNDPSGWSQLTGTSPQGYFQFSVESQAQVPVPGTLGLMGAALAGLIGVRRRHRRG